MPNQIQKVSVVIPIYNEEKNIKPLYQELKRTLGRLDQNYEIIYVNDCSTDHSLKILKSLWSQDKHLKIISLLGNQGQTAALSAGFKSAQGEAVIAMDGDGQHDPRYIPKFVAAISAGFDVVDGWKDRDEGRSRFKFFLSRQAHKIIAKITGVKMKYFGATMKGYHKNILKNLDLSGELHRFAGALIYYKGIKIKEIPIKIRVRTSGKSHYKLTKILKVALDLILIRFLIKYSKTPFRVFGLFGVLLNLLGFIGIAGVFIAKYGFGASTARNVSVLVISAIFCIIGVQFIFFGLIAELISRLYYTSGRKQFYNIKEEMTHATNSG